MPFSRPTPFELRERLAAEIQAALPGADARQRRSVEEVMVRLTAIAANDLHGHLGWAAEQLLPDTAESELLDRHGAIWGIGRRPAAPARGPVSLVGADGATIPAGTEFRRSDDARFALDAAVSLIAGLGTGQVTALVSGVAGNSSASQNLAPISPVIGLTSASIAAPGLTGGLDVEDDATLRGRIIARIQAPPAGGTRADYLAWALAVPGVERAFVFAPHVGLGTVGVALLAPGGSLPSAGLVAAVQAALDARRPVTALVTAFAPPTLAVPVTLSISPDTAEQRAAVTAGLASFFATEAAPGETLRRSRLAEAISGVAGEAWHGLTVPSADVVPAAAQLPILGTVTFT
ncbi:MAG: baseplate J/gp47 family protein [Roseococcus sp.]|nr:baseplate J/gp47 family protein [Roseococcus sp.]